MSVKHHSRTYINYGPKATDERLLEMARKWAGERNILTKQDRDGIKVVGTEEQIEQLDELLWAEGQKINFRWHKFTPLGRKLVAEEKAAAREAKMAAKKAAMAAKAADAAKAPAKPAAKDDAKAADAKPAEKKDAAAAAKPAEKKAADAKPAKKD